MSSLVACHHVTVIWKCMFGFPWGIGDWISLLMSTEAIHGRSEPDLLLPLDDQKTRASPRPRAGSQEACQPRGTKTIAQAFKSHPATLTGEVSAEDIQYSKEACNIAISGNIKHLVYPLRLSTALGFTWAEQALYSDPFHVTTIARQSWW